MTTERRLYRNVMDELLRLIDGGEYPVGGRLPPERELAQRFDVSRPTVREAIIALEVLGRVRVKTGSGVYVLESESPGQGGIDRITAYELTECRALVEGEAAALAANHITDEELKQLEDSLKDMAEENSHGDLASGDADRRFHQIIASATRNEMIVAVIEHLWFVRDNAPQVFEAYKSICELDGARRVEEHRDIVRALNQRDPVAARAAMHEHFTRILNKLISTIEAEQMETARVQAEEARKRFSLDHLLTAS